jgi:hypothetical protein
MTSQSRAWAEEQRDVPGDAWRVLYALANYANHRTGEIHFNADDIAEEACIQPTALPKYLGALRRNGYLAIDTGKQSGKEKHYWLLFERNPGSLPWSWNAAEIAEENDSAPQLRPAPSNVPVRFSAAAQAKGRDKVKPEPRKDYPIILGSDADKAWRAYCKRENIKQPFEMNVIVEGGGIHRGYYKPSLFPPKEQEQIAV